MNTLMPASRLTQPQELHDMLLFRLWRLTASASRPVIQMCEEEFGVTRREWRMLAELASNDGMQSSQLAEQTGLDRAQTSRAVTSLVIKGFVVREPRPSDRREVPLRLSEKGLALYERLLPRVAALNRDLVSVLSQTEADALDAVLRRLQAQAQSAD
ncbi:MarR family winged helix-turn-helix transcriptional regulator [Ottowia thiooxydans]|uniref:MarR family winged helix-turn-helix transcriptional regulator n=1 Tax=Ottowia thiooxydans TaxID=219182 RepID=UPI0012EB51E0|nr:MarR family transcriptional regulator [Ottowia thiooxydans]